jgi:hypothetical protein
MGLLGASGVVGTLPSGGLLDNTVAPLPAGSLVIIPGLVLTPMQAPLAVAMVSRHHDLLPSLWCQASPPAT